MEQLPFFPEYSVSAYQYNAHTRSGNDAATKIQVV
jgi:hypothetical protein